MLRFEATRGALQRPERCRAVRYGGGRRPELPRRRRRHRRLVAKVSEMVRNKLERDLMTREGGRATVRAGSLAGEGADKDQGHRKVVNGQITSFGESNHDFP